MTFEGTDVTLQCSSKQSSIPISYTWRRVTNPSSEAPGAVPSTSVQGQWFETFLKRANQSKHIIISSAALLV